MSSRLKGEYILHGKSRFLDLLASYKTKNSFSDNKLSFNAKSTLSLARLNDILYYANDKWMFRRPLCCCCCLVIFVLLGYGS